MYDPNLITDKVNVVSPLDHSQKRLVKNGFDTLDKKRKAGRTSSKVYYEPNSEHSPIRFSEPTSSATYLRPQRVYMPQINPISSRLDEQERSSTPFRKVLTQQSECSNDLIITSPFHNSKPKEDPFIKSQSTLSRALSNPPPREAYSPQFSTTIDFEKSNYHDAQRTKKATTGLRETTSFSGLVQSNSETISDKHETQVNMLRELYNQDLCAQVKKKFRTKSLNKNQGASMQRRAKMAESEVFAQNYQGDKSSVDYNRHSHLKTESFVDSQRSHFDHTESNTKSFSISKSRFEFNNSVVHTDYANDTLPAIESADKTQYKPSQANSSNPLVKELLSIQESDRDLQMKERKKKLVVKEKQKTKFSEPTATNLEEESPRVTTSKPRYSLQLKLRPKSPKKKEGTMLEMFQKDILSKAPSERYTTTYNLHAKTENSEDNLAEMNEYLFSKVKIEQFEGKEPSNKEPSIPLEKIKILKTDTNESSSGQTIDYSILKTKFGLVDAKKKERSTNMSLAKSNIQKMTTEQRYQKLMVHH